MLTFDNVELYYDHVYALKGVTIDVDEGETVALIGANGAGKSSILRAITGLRRIRSGSITYQGERIDGRNPAEIVAHGHRHGARGPPGLPVHDGEGQPDDGRLHPQRQGRHRRDASTACSPASRG